jgi:indole-3-glycerol phosphate synthase
VSKIPDILDRIVRSCRQRLLDRKAVIRLEDLQAQARSRGIAASLRSSLAIPGLSVIAELKRASPSAGVLRASFPVQDLAAGLVAGGAVALSVLTEEEFFQGDPAYLADVAQKVPGVPLLRKDFLVDPWQIWESRALGADAVLLIAAVLEQGQLEMMMAEADAAGLECLVEVHDQDELTRVLRAGAGIIGVNARDLHTFKVDLPAAAEMVSKLPTGVAGVAESGILGWEDMELVRRAGYQGVLIGSALMRTPEPGKTLKEWIDRMPAGSQP